MLFTLSTRQLKKLASGEKIKNYSHLRKSELVEALSSILGTGTCDLPLSDPEPELVPVDLLVFVLTLAVFCLVWSSFALFVGGLAVYRFGVSTRQWMSRFENTDVGSTLTSTIQRARNYSAWVQRGIWNGVRIQSRAAGLMISSASPNRRSSDRAHLE